MGKTNWMKYDSFGRLSEAYDFKLQKKLICYDSLGRIATNFWFANGATHPSNSTEYYYNSLGQLTNITERSGTNASSGYVASVDLPGNRNRYVAALAKVPADVAGGISGLALGALAILCLVAADVRRRIILPSVSDIRVNPCNPWFKLFAYLALRASFTSLPSVEKISVNSSNSRMSLPSFFWRYATYILVVSLVGSDPHFDSLWTVRASCVSQMTAPTTSASPSSPTTPTAISPK